MSLPRAARAALAAVSSVSSVPSSGFTAAAAAAPANTARVFAAARVQLVDILDELCGAVSNAKHNDHPTVVCRSYESVQLPLAIQRKLSLAVDVLLKQRRRCLDHS